MKRLLAVLLLCLVPLVAHASPTSVYPDPKILEAMKAIGFDVTIDPDYPCEPGLIKWNSDDGTFDFCTDIPNHSVQAGQEIAPRVVNKSGQVINNGDIVNITGAQGNRIAVGLANAADPSARVIGMATATIADNDTGPVTLIGKVRGIDTRNWSAGDFLYLSATEDGAITNSIPDAPNRKVFIGIAENSTVNGSVWVVISNGRPIGGLHDVALSASLSASDDSTLLWNSTSSRWEPVPHTYGQLYKGLTGTTLDFAVDSTFVNVTGLTEDLESNVILNGTNGSIEIIDEDDYICNFTHSFQSATPAKYALAIGVNGIAQVNACATVRTISTGTDSGGVPVNCQGELLSGDLVTAMVNASTGSETIQFETVNLNCRRQP
jgi:hypothetical protein